MPRVTNLSTIYTQPNGPKACFKMAMSNNLIFFLLESGLNLDCSVYSLTSGSIQFQDAINGSWSRNFTQGKFLPAYYVTNCSIPRLIEQINDLASNNTADWERQYKGSPYNQRDNGDTFIALLFTVSGSCVSCLMLSLLFFLSPKHKRKPILTQLSTFFYTIVTIILLEHITKVSSDEYYADTLDIINIYREIYVSKYYRIMIVISQLLTQLAWIQIILKLSRQRFKWKIGAVSVILVIGYTITNIVHEAKFNVVEAVLLRQISNGSTYRGWRMSRTLLRVLQLLWFAINLIYYSILIKRAKVCYCRKLLPLSGFIWCLFIIDIILSIFSISLYEYRWLVNIWLRLIPFLIDIYLLTMVWEWIYSIRSIEKRQELVGVLGRRISLDDVVSIKLNGNNDCEEPLLLRRSLKLPFATHFEALKTKLRGYSSIGNGRAEDDHKGVELDQLSSASDTLLNSNQHDAAVENEGSTERFSLHSEATSDVSYAVQYVDGDWDENEQPQEGPSSQYYTEVPVDTVEQPPPFERHPGFNAGDYWPDEK